MPQRGIEKQNPPDQRGRGKNPENAEGQANQRNHDQQVRQNPPAPKPRG